MAIQTPSYPYVYVSESYQVSTAKQITNYYKKEYKMIKDFEKQIKNLSVTYDIPVRVIATIAMNESRGDANVKPYWEKTWRYFTDRQGKPLNLVGGNKDIQEQALKILGQKEFEFQIQAHGAFQTVGSVLRELGYAPDEMDKDFMTQGNFAMKHLSKMRDRFVRKYRAEPTNQQLYAMYNGGFGAVTEDGTEDYVAEYLANAQKNERKFVNG